MFRRVVRVEQMVAVAELVGSDTLEFRVCLVVVQGM